VSALTGRQWSHTHIRTHRPIELQPEVTPWYQNSAKIVLGMQTRRRLFISRSPARTRLLLCCPSAKDWNLLKPTQRASIFLSHP
jgi:hypothetical protein